MYLDKSGLMALWNKIKTMFAPKSHTHDISTLDGTAKSAAKLSTARTIALSGAVSGSAKFDGSGDATIVTTGQTATASAAGLMSADDKSKLDNIDAEVRELLTAKVPGKIFVGTVVSTIESSSSASGHEARLFTESEFKANFGRSFDPMGDYVGVMNADGLAESTYINSATYFRSGNIWVGVPGGSDGNTIRLNYLVVLGD